MAKYQTSKPSRPNEEIEIEEGEEEEEEKSLRLRSNPQPSRSSSDESLSREGRTRGSVRGTLTLASRISVLGNERDSSDFRFDSTQLTGAVARTVNSAAGGSEAKPVPVLTLSGDSTAAACRSFPSGFQVGVSVCADSCFDVRFR